MTNREISIIFSRIGDILEIKSENVFRVRAYRTAAQNIMGLARELSDIYAANPEDLENIPGIGKDLKEKIIEMISTGKLKYYEALAREFPKGFLDMLSLSGLGPKKLKKLRDEIKIKNVDDLEKACKKGKLENIEGMGAKTQEKLLGAIEHFRKREGRMLLPEADEWAGKIVSYLKKDKNFKKIEKAGSLRRGKETVGDIDILTTAARSKKAMDRFTSYPETESIIAKGMTKASIQVTEGPQVDLRVVDAKCFGAALQYFTGSKQHSVEVRKIAKGKGYKVSEYGVFSVDKKTGRERMAAGKTEEKVYKKLGMEWIPPELRENRGEIEAAIKGTLPKNLIKLSDIKGDLHLHSVASDGNARVEELASQAKKKGYEYIAVTDHSKLIKIANGMDEKRLLKHADRVRKLDKKIKGIKILVGIEVDILEDGKLDLEDYALREMDIVIAAIHSRFALPKEKQTARILKGLDNKYVNALAHPSGRLITRRTGLNFDLDKVFSKAAEENIFLEINTHGERIDLNDLNCRRAGELGARFMISTDAHDISQMDLVKYGVITARRGWLERKDVLNTYPLEKMLKELKK
ncbi:MAG: DNA polymerase/3'-5' exonuclease PolX [Candidatus Omnitrophica bacterium]|nr:DNA polymerase/3'-5' exonuclease PolX [Candidatus Omnitrophota bacterium]